MLLVVHGDGVVGEHVHLVATATWVVLLAIVGCKLVFVLEELILVTLGTT